MDVVLRLYIVSYVLAGAGAGVRMGIIDTILVQIVSMKMVLGSSVRPSFIGRRDVPRQEGLIASCLLEVTQHAYMVNCLNSVRNSLMVE